MNNNSKKILINILSVFLLSIMFLPFVYVSAETPATGETPGITGTITPPLADVGLKELLIRILDRVVIRIGAIIAILSLIYSGYLFVSATGDPGKVSKAREHFTWTIVGIVILLGAKAIVVLVTGTIESVTGTELFSR